MPLPIAPVLVQRPSDKDAPLMKGLALLFDPRHTKGAAAFVARLSHGIDEDVAGRAPTMGKLCALPDTSWGTAALAPPVSRWHINALQGILRSGCLNTDVLFVSHAKGDPAFAVFTPGCVALQTHDVLGYAKAQRARQDRHGPEALGGLYSLATLRMEEARSAHHALSQRAAQAHALRCLLAARPQMQAAMDLVGVRFPLFDAPMDGASIDDVPLFPPAPQGATL